MSRQLTEREKEAVERFTQLITCIIELDDLVEKLDEVLWKFAIYMLEDTSICGHPDNTKALYWVKELKEVLKPNENL